MWFLQQTIYLFTQLFPLCRVTIVSILSQNPSHLCWIRAAALVQHFFMVLRRRAGPQFIPGNPGVKFVRHVQHEAQELQKIEAVGRRSRQWQDVGRRGHFNQRQWPQPFVPIFQSTCNVWNLAMGGRWTDPPDMSCTPTINNCSPRTGCLGFSLFLSQPWPVGVGN